MSGVYLPRRGNVVIGVVENVTIYGWVVNIGVIGSAFLPVAEYPRYIESDDLESYIAIGDLILCKVFRVKRKGVDLTMKSQGLGKIEDGMITHVNSNKVPRVIGKEGSMINLIKNATGCDITVGQNGFIWIRGNSVEDELRAKKAILFVVDRSYVYGLTDAVKKFLEENKKKGAE